MMFMLEKLEKKKNTIAAVLLLCYTALLIYWMLFGFGRVSESNNDYRYNLIPFETVVSFILDESIMLSTRLINVVGNIGVFVPFGILMPFIWDVRGRELFYRFFVALFMMECLQLISKRGVFDIDDLLLNSIGFFVGFFGFIVYRKCKQIVLSKNDSPKTG